MKVKILTAIVLMVGLVCGLTSASQAQQTAEFVMNDVFTVGGAGNDAAATVYVDEEGTGYVGGVFEETVDFDPGDGTDELTAELDDGFVSVYNNDGYVETVVFGGPGYDDLSDVASDRDGGGDGEGRVYVVGAFEETVDFDPSEEVDERTSAGEDDIFLSVFDGNGNYQFTYCAGGVGVDEAYAISVDAAGNVAITGIFSGTVDFDPGDSTDEHTSSGDADIFVTRFDADGNYQGTMTFGGPDNDEAEAIAHDSEDNLYLAGFFQNTVDFDPTDGVDEKTASHWSDIFVTKLKSDGTYGWTAVMGGSGDEGVDDIAVDDADNVVIVGDFEETVDFDPSDATDEHTADGGEDLFVTKLSGDGSYQWTYTAGGTGEDAASAVVCTEEGQIVVAGVFRDTVDFNPLDAETDEHSSNGEDDIFLTVLGADGSYVGTQTIGGSGYDDAEDLAIGNNGQLFMVGAYEGTVDFDPGTGVDEHTANGEDDIFVAEFTRTASGVTDLVVGRGHDNGIPGISDEEHDYWVEVGGNGLTDLQVTTPWGEQFTASDYLPTGTYSDADVSGTWNLEGMWVSGSISFDGNGTITGGSYVEEDGESLSFTEGSYSVNSDGTVTATVHNSNNATFELAGAFNASGDVLPITVTDYPQDDMSLAILTKPTGTYSDADVSGTWNLEGMWVSGSISFDGNGTITGGSYVEEDGESLSFTEGSYSVNSDGTVTATVHNSNNATFELAGAFNASGDVLPITVTDYPQDDMSLAILTKPTGTYSDADVSGTWNLEGMWVSGSISFDGNGTITGGSYVEEDGESLSFTEGSYSVNSDGTVTATVHNSNNATFELAGAFNASGDVLPMTRTDYPQDDMSLTVLTKPTGWSGEYYKEEIEELDILIEAYGDDGVRWIEVGWENLPESEWNQLEENTTELVVSYTGGSWTGTVDFSSSPMPTQEPEITYPAHGETGVDLQPTFTWEEWTDPGSGNPGVWQELENFATGEVVYAYEDWNAPSDTTSWTLPDELDADTEYEFYVDFHHAPTVTVNGVDARVISYQESNVNFTTTGDLAGTWQVHALASGPGAPWWLYGRITVASDGMFNGTLHESDNHTDQAEGQFQIDESGVVTLVGASQQHHGHMTADKNAIVMVDTFTTGSPGTTEIRVLTRQGNDYEQADLSGTWQVHSLASGPGAPWWEYGPVTVEADGTFSGTLQEYDSDPDQVEGQVQIDDAGVVTLVGASQQHHGHMTADKNAIVMVDTWTTGSPGTTELRVLTRQGNHYEQADLSGTWQIHSLASGPGAPWWQYGPVTVEADGAFSGTLQEYDSDPDQVEGQVQIDDAGVVTLVGASQQHHGHMTADKNAIVMVDTWTTGSPGTTELRVLTRSLSASGEPDLTASVEPNEDIEAHPGQSLSINVTAENVGNEDATTGGEPAEWDTTLYLSDGDQFGEDTDTEVAEFAVTELAAGASETRTLTFNAPDEPGTYYLASKADDFDAVHESDETNNWSGVVTLLVEEVQGDEDGDGLPDEWEMEMLGTLEYDGDADPDGDGFSNLQEYENGTDPLRYVLELTPGWNLVSIALAPSDYSVDGIFGDTIDKPAWYWDGEAYDAAEDILPLAGQWVYSPAEDTVSIDIGAMDFPDSPDTDGDGLADSVEEDIGTDPERYAIELHPGWNLVSVCRVPTDNTPEAIFGDKIIMPVWKWQDGKYKRAEQIKPLKGYWIYFDGEQPSIIVIIE